MKRSRASEVLGPHALEFGGFAKQDRLHHSHVVLVAWIQTIEVRDGRFAHIENRSPNAISAASGKNSGRAPARHRRCPEDLLAGEVSRVIECSWISKIMRRANAAFDLHVLAVMEWLRRRRSDRSVIVGRETHACTRSSASSSVNCSRFGENTDGSTTHPSRMTISREPASTSGALPVRCQASLKAPIARSVSVAQIRRAFGGQFVEQSDDSTANHGHWRGEQQGRR